MAWILGVNNVYDDVLPPVTIEILAAVFFKLLSFRKLQLQYWYTTALLSLGATEPFSCNRCM